MTRRGFLTRLGGIALLGALAAFAWQSLPDAPRRESGRSGHEAHAGDPAFRADGVVVSVDRKAGMVTISHGPLQNLGMPPMTMGFSVTDRASLETLVVGARIRFHPDVLDGVFMATRIERVSQ
jgi:Cu(I)/Ag(I) efflux system periplasmic protein CusF